MRYQMDKYFLPSLLLIGAVAQAAPPDDAFTATVQPFLRRNCIGCHNGNLTSGGLNLAPYLTAAASVALNDRERWELVVQKLRAGEMPPKGAARPPADQVAGVVNWVESSYARLDRDTPSDPGRVTAHRLNRYEYDNTVRDLLGLDLQASGDFPVDPYGYGFDNIGDVLSLSPVLTEKYLKAAEHIANIAIPSAESMQPVMSRYLAERIGQARQLHIEATHEFPVDGEYTLRSAWFQGLKVGTNLEGRLYLDGKEISRHPLTVYTEMDRGFQTSGVHVTAGLHKIEAGITYDGILKDPPYLEYLQVYGPGKRTPFQATPAYRRIFVCAQHTPECARLIVEPLVRRAYRRPAARSEIDELLSLVRMAQSRGDSFESGIRVALEAILINPNFLFRMEHDPAAGGSIPGIAGGSIPGIAVGSIPGIAAGSIPGIAAGSVHRITDIELASRLSYFLWSSMPDDELLGLAVQDRLHVPEVLHAQMKRLLGDRRSRALVDNFGGQWLQFRNLDVLKPDPQKFPEFDAGLREAMRTETELFFAAIVREDRSILDFLDGRFTYLNERLARHYGIDGVTGREFRRVELDGTQRSGVLTQASVLTVSSYPTRTSPVIRGKWVLENLLDTPPPPPPPDVPPLNEAAVGTTVSMREQLEKHRSNPVCAGCHGRMDPIGFGLENYDAIGRYRTTEGKFPVDSSGTLPSGKSFAGAAELKTILRDDPQIFTRALSVKLLTYALGRGLESYDRAAISTIADRVQQNDYRFSALVQAIIDSVPFEMRRSGDTGLSLSKTAQPPAELKP
jgi:mono/diheme cytochrome c family protein